jgi:hypothetical protein
VDYYVHRCRGWFSLGFPFPSKEKHNRNENLRFLARLGSYS